MGRKEFVRDCIAASEWIERGFAQTVAQRERVAGVARHPAEDGVVVVSCRGPLHGELAEDDAEVWVRIDDLHKYPASHRDVLVYTPSHHVHLSATLADLSASRALCARTVSDAIAILSAALKIQCPAIAVPHSTATIATTTTEAVEQSDKGSSDLDQVDEELDLQDTDSDDDDDIFITHPSVRYATSASASHSRLATSSSHIIPASDASLRARLIKDLKLCTRAPSTTLPLKAGVLWEKGDGEFVIYTLMSIRTLLSSHVLSWDQVKAWNLPLDAHVVVLTKFLHEYAFVNSDGIQEPAPRPQFRVQLSSSADLDELEVFAAFRQNWKFSGGTSEGGAEMTAVGHLHEFLLSAPLSDLLNGRFLALLGLRLKLACSWAAAEAVHSQDLKSVTKVDKSDVMTLQGLCDDADAREEKWKSNALQDNFEQLETEDKHLSFPLILHRYVMRRIYLATKFCLVCHKVSEVDVEALRPFVCSNALCTYQYISLGMGPSIEDEILHNANVVDLLVSLAYSAGVDESTMRPYPHGVGIFSFKSYMNATGGVSAWNRTQVTGVDTRWVSGSGEVVDFKSEPIVDDTIEIEYQNEVYCGTIVSIQDDCTMTVNPSIPFPPSRSLRLRFALRRQSYNGFTFESSQNAVASIERVSPLAPSEPKVQALLDKLPSIYVLLNHLRCIRGELPVPEPDTTYVTRMTADPHAVTSPRMREPPKRRRMNYRNLSLKPMLDSIDVLLYPLLRWIICSHRGFIRELKEVEERVHGVHGGYVQFQLVLGSPEKEARLQLCRKEHAADKMVPTLFAWHGSPLHNWHSIIRNGLNFHKVTHGRATLTDHARDLQTSEGYGGVTTSIWGNSTLKVTRCISLNEIVNAPEQFQSSSPYLVVQYEDWVQARYLLVGKLGQVAATPYSKTAQQPTSQVTPIEVPPPFAKYKVLDTRIKPTGSNGQALFIPDSFASAARGEGKKLVIFDLCKGFTNLERLECEKRETAETRAAEIRPVADSPTATNVAKNSSVSMMKVEVGMMPSPSYATTAASNYLHRELIRIVRLQEKLSVEERGWVLDVDNISNLYQWRLRLVGLDESLPLAKDMKVKNVYDKGIILEVRFGPDCPLTPPFIRIIEPRFMPFSQGGVRVRPCLLIRLTQLKMSGWSPIYTFESVLLQVRMALSNLDPHPARLDPSRWNQSYGV